MFSANILYLSEVLAITLNIGQKENNIRGIEVYETEYIGAPAILTELENSKQGHLYKKFLYTLV